jgi:hypothetical protein
VVVLVDEAAEDACAKDATVVMVRDCRRQGDRVGWSLVAGLIGTVLVVMSGVLCQHEVGVGRVHDQDVVEDFAA